MTINYLKNIKFISITVLLTILNISLNHSVVKAGTVNKSVKSITKAPKIYSKTSENHFSRLHVLSNRIKVRTQQKNLELLNNSEVSQTKQTIPQKHRSLIANFFGGSASWYGPGFNGRTTANGEVYDQNAMTAAHPSLKFGTRVKVTNLNNNRSVVVRINDRGPYSGGRVIDLSAAAASALNMISSGVAPVEMTILGQ
jgi:rare lipoprotein A